jgi:arginine repressor
MISKRETQGRVLEIAQNQALWSQEELASLLDQGGIGVTLSRDIRGLGLVKDRDGYPTSEAPHPAASDEQIRRTFEQYVIRTGMSGNIIMNRTSPGKAQYIGLVRQILLSSFIHGCPAFIQNNAYP